MGTAAGRPAYPLAMNSAKTTIIRPGDPELRAAWHHSAAFAAVTFLFHFAANLWQAHIGWGYFRDEFYYLMCGRHLAWGYVDHAPLVAVQARLAETIFGHSLAGLRMFTTLGAAARVFLTGIIAWSLGGRRSAQALAMLAVSIAPIYLVLDGFLSMNSCESLFWMTSLLALILIESGRSPRLWILFGISSGLGLLNKPSMAFFLIALLAALLFTPQRRILWSKWALAGVAIALLIFIPYVHWQAANHWPMLEFLHSSQLVHADDRPSPLGLLLSQWKGLHPLGIFVWLPGLVWLLLRPRWRWLGLTYVIFMAMMLANHAKDYYPTPIYPLLFAAGGLAWQSRLSLDRSFRLIAFPVLESLLLLTGLILLPVGTPILTPQQWVAYNVALHLRGATGDSDGLMPQYLADRFGWTEEVATVTRAVASLSPEDRAHVYIFCSNYGEAGALEFLAPDLPPVISGHNNYYLWGPRGATGEVMIVINGASQSTMLDNYDQAERIDSVTSNPYAMPWERKHNIFIARGRKKGVASDWLSLKHYD